MKKSIAVFGGGAAALAFASFIDTSKYDVTIYEQNKTCGRKFLVAGKGGFNLTHSDPVGQMENKYIPSSFLREALHHFDNTHLRTWLAELGIPTFVGSSKRVFPIKGIKPIEVLNAIITHLDLKHIDIKTNKRWIGWNAEGMPLLEGGEEVNVDYFVFAFGGGSWKKTGSTGSWLPIFQKAGIKVNPFQASNCAYEVKWSKLFIEQNEGKPLKNIEVRCTDQSIKGEVVITKFGLEGSAIYALSNGIRNQLMIDHKAIIYLDLKPQFTTENIKSKKADTTTKNTTDFLRRDLKLSKVQIALLKSMLSKEEFQDEAMLVKSIKGLPIEISGMAPIDEAISTVGGVALSAITPEFELREKESTFCIGEMLDWDAPTGGYLLQACFSMGAYLADYLNTRVG